MASEVKEEKNLSRARIQLIIFTDLLVRSPLWALLILAIYGVIMGGAMWFLVGVVKPSIDRKALRKEEMKMMQQQKLPAGADERYNGSDRGKKEPERSK